jgi:hypothetical protein
MIFLIRESARIQSGGFFVFEVIFSWDAEWDGWWGVRGTVAMYPGDKKQVVTEPG